MIRFHCFCHRIFGRSQQVKDSCLDYCQDLCTVCVYIFGFIFDVFLGSYKMGYFRILWVEDVGLETWACIR